MDAFAVKNWLVTLLVALVAGVASFGAFYTANREPAALKAAARDRDSLEWLRVEFKLTDPQYAAIKQLHAQYGSVCADHCAAIMAAQKRNAPAAEVTRLENACVQSMTEHFHRVAALMTPKEGERYLAIVLPRIQDYDHRGSPNVEARP
jgi:hypothetical protein